MTANPSSPAVDTDHEIILRAVAYWDGHWPPELTSGVMFFEGLRIERREFMSVARGGI